MVELITNGSKLLIYTSPKCGITFWTNFCTHFKKKSKI